MPTRVNRFAIVNENTLVLTRDDSESDDMAGLGYLQVVIPFPAIECFSYRTGDDETRNSLTLGVRASLDLEDMTFEGRIDKDVYEDFKSTFFRWRWQQEKHASLKPGKDGLFDFFPPSSRA